MRLILGWLDGLRDPGLLRLRGAAVSMAAALLSFWCALFLDHRYHLTSSSVVLTVVLTLTLGRAGHHGGRSWVERLLAPVLLPLLAVASTEVGKRLFTHPDVGDTLFVLGMSAAIWVRRFGSRGRRAGMLLAAAFTAILITPGPAVPLGGHVPSRWWAAVIALMALAWTRSTQWVAERLGVLPRERPHRAAAPPAPPSTPASSGRRVSASTAMSLQMGVALAAAFASGREAFGLHWTWVVLSAYIVGSGNRGRGDVAHKAVLRVLGAAGGTVIATLLSGAFSPGDHVAIAFLFGVLAVALWLRPLSYAFWAAGMTSALALLYDYYGESGGSILLTRLEGILLGAAIAVVAAWVIFPIRNVDVIRKQLSIALGTLSEVLSRGPQPSFRADEASTYRSSITTGDAAAGSLHVLRHLPASWQDALPYAVACRALKRALPVSANGNEVSLHMEQDTRRRLAADVTAARRALAAAAAPELRAALPDTATRIADVMGSSYR